MKDATGQALAYVYARETRAGADIAKVLTFDEARRVEQHRKSCRGSESRSSKQPVCVSLTQPFN